MQQHDQIIAGTLKPARATMVDAQSIKVLARASGIDARKLCGPSTG
jgi:hypothetical protein